MPGNLVHYLLKVGHTDFWIELEIHFPTALYTKEGSGNPMISAHLNGQIFANIETTPYCFMGEE